MRTNRLGITGVLAPFSSAIAVPRPCFKLPPLTRLQLAVLVGLFGQFSFSAGVTFVSHQRPMRCNSLLVKLQQPGVRRRVAKRGRSFFSAVRCRIGADSDSIFSRKSWRDESGRRASKEVRRIVKWARAGHRWQLRPLQFQQSCLAVIASGVSANAGQ